MAQLELLPQADTVRAISPMLEMGAYEALWASQKTTFHSLAKKFEKHPEHLPSDLVDHETAMAMAERVLAMADEARLGRFDVRIHGTLEYPERLRDARNPVELLYYQGWWSLVSTPCVAVVGTRSPSPEGLQRTRRLVQQLVQDGWTIVSGLARGIDSEAHRTAIRAGGLTIAVLGTPLFRVYPEENADLQRQLAKDFLVVSQVPFYRYSQADYRSNRRFFPERNHTMSALSQATLIVEASDTSGTLIQARSALQQGRKLFILDSCFQTEGLEWPWRLAKEGAVRIRDYEEFRRELPPPNQD